MRRRAGAHAAAVTDACGAFTLGVTPVTPGAAVTAVQVTPLIHSEALSVGASEIVEYSAQSHGLTALGMSGSAACIKGINIKVHPRHVVNKTL